MENLFSLIDKNIVVTGGAQGIGKAFAEALGLAGANIYIFDINQIKLTETAQELKNKNISVQCLLVDVTNKKQVEQAIAKLTENDQKIHVAVNNVGIGANSAAEETSELEWRNIIETNLTAMFLFAQAVGKIMIMQKQGVIINTASMSSITIPRPQKQAAYNTSKAGVVQLTKSLAAEWGGMGVRVNCISPGIVDTPLINTDALRSHKFEWIKQNPMKRLATVDDLKGSIIYLASDASNYVNGHNLVIDGGHSLW